MTISEKLSVELEDRIGKALEQAPDPGEFALAALQEHLLPELTTAVEQECAGRFTTEYRERLVWHLLQQVECIMAEQVQRIQRERARGTRSAR